MKIWDRVKELEEWIDDMNPKQRKFIKNLLKFLDPHNSYEELSKRQVKHIDWLYKKYCLGEEEPTW